MPQGSTIKMRMRRLLSPSPVLFRKVRAVSVPCACLNRTFQTFALEEAGAGQLCLPWRFWLQMCCSQGVCPLELTLWASAFENVVSLALVFAPNSNYLLAMGSEAQKLFVLGAGGVFSSHWEWANLNYCRIFLGMNVLILLKLLLSFFFFSLRSLSIETQLLSLNKAVLFHLDKYKDSRAITLQCSIRWDLCSRSGFPFCAQTLRAE